MVAVEFSWGVEPRRSLQGRKAMHPDHLHLIMNACLAAAAATGARMAIELAQYVLIVLD
jgi:hypothetical protein